MKTSVQNSARYKIKKGFITQKIDNKITIFDGEKSLLYSFNEVGSLIFEKLRLGWEYDKIVDFLVRKYSITKEKARNGMQEFIDELKQKKILFYP